MSLSRTALAASLSGLLTCAAGAQCVPDRSPEFDPGDPDGAIGTLAWFDDGEGMRLYAAGDPRLIGGTLTQVVARWDGQSWEVVPVLLGINKLKVLPNTNGGSSLYAIGNFDTHLIAAAWNGKQFEVLPALAQSVTVATDATVFDPERDGPSPSLLIAQVAGTLVTDWFEQTAKGCG